MKLSDDSGIIDRYWDAMKHPTLPTQHNKQLTFRVEGHFHAPPILGSILETIRRCPQHKFLLSSNDPTTALSAPDNCLTMLRANIHDRIIEDYLATCDDLGLPKVLNVQGGFQPSPLLSRFDWFLVSGFKFAYIRSVIRGVHSMARPCYVETFVDTVRLSKIPAQIRCRELPQNLWRVSWLDAIENLFISQQTVQNPL